MKPTNNFIHQIGQIVYLITDPEQLDRMVTGICIRQDGISYELSGVDVRWVYEFEIATEKDILKTITNQTD